MFKEMKTPALSALFGLLAACDGGTPTNTNSVAPAAAAKPVAFKETGKAEGVEFTVTKVDTRSQLGIAAAGMIAEPSETFVVVRYTLKNTGKSPLGFTDRPSISLMDGKGQAYQIDMPAATMATDGLAEMTGMSSDLNPNVSAKSVGAWKVEKTAFDKATWKVQVGGDPEMTFALK
jgi:hypothetical protein